MIPLDSRTVFPFDSLYVTVRKKRPGLEILGTILTIAGVIGGIYFAYVWITYWIACTWFPFPGWWYPWYGYPTYPSVPNVCSSAPVTSLILQTIIFAVTPFAVGEWLSSYGHGEHVLSPYTCGIEARPETSALDQLERLKGLLDSNAITKEEFDAQKRRLLKQQ